MDADFGLFAWLSLALWSSLINLAKLQSKVIAITLFVCLSVCLFVCLSVFCVSAVLIYIHMCMEEYREHYTDIMMLYHEVFMYV